MGSDSRVIDDILCGARQKSETEGGLTFEKFVNRVVLPGMALRIDDEAFNQGSWLFGPGLTFTPNLIRKRNNSILVRQVGILKHRKIDNGSSSDVQRGSHGHKACAEVYQNRVWLERSATAGTNKTLAPLGQSAFRCTSNQFQVGDRVVGVVLRRAGDNYMIDIGCASPASLNYLSFEGASKKNRPDIVPGDVIYATITQSDRDLEIELSCVDDAGRAAGMGILGRHEPGTVGNAGGMAGGIMLHSSPDGVRRLIDRENFPLISVLAKKFRFQVTLGANGWIWLTAHLPKDLVLLANAISMTDHLTNATCCSFVDELSS